MTKDKAFAVDKSMECLVCGKIFSRGHNDLERHMKGTTLKHLFQKQHTSTYAFRCSICGYHFTSLAHLNLHNTASSCNKPKTEHSNTSRTPQMGLSPDNDANDTTILTFLDESQVNTGHFVPPSDRIKGMDCKVCGKFFSKGQLDLSRHMNGISIKHLFSNERSDGYPFECIRSCGYYFTTAEHRDIHQQMTSCNPDVGFRRSPLNMKVLDISAKRPVDSSDSTKNHPVSTSASACSMTRSKRIKIIVPEDRKAFFAIVSLLIDPLLVSKHISDHGTNLIDSNENQQLFTITEDNYENFLQEDKKAVVNKLKRYVNNSRSSFPFHLKSRIHFFTAYCYTAAIETVVISTSNNSIKSKDVVQDIVIHKTIMDYFVSTTIISLVGRNILRFQRTPIEHEYYFSINSSTEYQEKVKEIVSSVLYYPSTYCMFDINGQLQTSMQYFLRNITRVLKVWLFRQYLIKFIRQPVVLHDGGNVALDWAYKNNEDLHEDIPSDAPVVILYHGLCGDSESEYIIHLVWNLLSAGYRVAVLISRGCGGLDLTNCLTFNGKNTDIEEAIQEVSKKYPTAKKMFFVGFSLGAAMTLKYLERVGKSKQNEANAALSEGSSPINAALCISPPWNFSYNKTRVFWFWSFLLVIPLKQYSWNHQKALKNFARKYPNINIWTILLRVWNMTQFDALLYPTYDENYQSVNDYYMDVSPCYDSKHISTPTLSISSMDDPICSHHECPTDPNKIGSGLAIVKTQYGGHLAFPEGGWNKFTSAWIDKVAIKWFDSFL